MRVDALALRLRPRTPFEAADLGVRLCQHAARSVYPCYLAVALPVLALAMAAGDPFGFRPMLILWWAKPWLDRTILFVLSRAAFGQTTRMADVWQAQRIVWWRRFWFTWTIRRLSAWRALTEPVYLLEGLPLTQTGRRVSQLRRRQVWPALLTTQAFLLTEAGLVASCLSLAFWFAPAAETDAILDIWTGGASALVTVGLPIAYAAAVLFLEPFFVAAGFGQYLNRRAELEAWDIEQEFRRAFTR